MQTFVTVVHIITCVLLVLVVLVQSGKGAEISASFGGSSQTVFGSSGGANFFTKFTQGAAAVFMITSLALTIMGGQNKKSLFESAPATQSQIPVPQTPPVKAPAVPAPAAPQAPAAKQTH
jgi:preprotein translocase subunit SecG